MKLLSKEEIKELANTIMINPSDKLCEEVRDAIKYINEDIEALKQFDTKGVDMMNYPNEHEHMFLREDEEVYHLDQEKALKNAYTSGEYVTIGKVVKSDDV